MRKYPRILFFIASAIATDAESDEAMELGPNVAFRNSTLVLKEGALEVCDGVAGLVPERYAAARPTAREAIEEWMRAESERRSRRAAGLPPAPEAEAAAPQAATAPPAAPKTMSKGSAAVKDPTPAPAAAAGWQNNA